MCLYVNKVLLDSGVLVIKVSKQLSGYITKYVTPYRKVPVPKDGVLRPNFFLNTVYKGNEIHGGVIHSYQFPHRHYFLAYALMPVAIDDRLYLRPVASRALYIPDLDKSDLKEKRMKLLRGPKENITIQSLTRVFALEGVDLEDYYDYDEDED